MQSGRVGLDRMGGNMPRRVIAGGHEIVAWDERADAVRALERDGRQWRLSPS
jgi:6-phosphogluconate dehydrogenase